MAENTHYGDSNDNPYHVTHIIPISNPNEVDGHAALVSSPCPSSLEGPPVANVFPDNDGSDYETVRPGVCEGLPAAREPREPEYPNFDIHNPSRDIYICVNLHMIKLL